MFICFNLRFMFIFCFFFFSSRRRHTRLQGDWSSDVCSSDLPLTPSVACAEGCLSYPETSLREPGSERRGVPPSGLQGQGCPSVVPVHQTLGLAASKLQDRKSTRLNSSHLVISYAVFCLKKKKKTNTRHDTLT